MRDLRAASRRLSLGVVAAAVFLAIALVEGATRVGYDFRQQSVSALALGPRGWIQRASFVAFGSVVAATTGAWRKILVGGRGARFVPTLVAIMGCALAALGVFAQDPAPGFDPEGTAWRGATPSGLAHLSLAAVATFASLACLCTMARRFASDPNWRGWSIYSLAVAVATFACATTYGLLSARARGDAGTFERIAIALPPLWTATFCARLHAGRALRTAPSDDGAAGRRTAHAPSERTAAHRAPV